MSSLKWHHLFSIRSFGSGNVGKRTGIIFNNGMNDFGVKNLKNQFGLPASSANYIVPQKRPTSSVSPTIVTDKDGDVRLVVGAAGGTKIITSTASVSKHFIKQVCFESIFKPNY